MGQKKHLNNYKLGSFRKAWKGGSSRNSLHGLSGIETRPTLLPNMVAPPVATAFTDCRALKRPAGASPPGRADRHSLHELSGIETPPSPVGDIPRPSSRNSLHELSGIETPKHPGQPGPAFTGLSGIETMPAYHRALKPQWHSDPARLGGSQALKPWAAPPLRALKQTLRTDLARWHKWFATTFTSCRALPPPRGATRTTRH